ncbi:hypothetical protein R1flu_000851 [Riccia fluitans]|uniref:Uncharacterized protein n=1 Tax=Riccia fluitans TaxID=41844 RepID=A0ABD1Y1L3_9MARC
MVNEALERELVILKHRAKESQQEAQKLALRLDTALLNLATKNQIITQVHEEISGLRAVVRALESEKLARQDESAAKQLAPGNSGDEQDYTSTMTIKPTNQEVLNHYLELCDSLVRQIEYSRLLPCPPDPLPLSVKQIVILESGNVVDLVSRALSLPQMIRRHTPLVKKKHTGRLRKHTE